MGRFPRLSKFVDELEPMFGSAETAGLLASLSLGGMLWQAWHLRKLVLVLVPLMLISILTVNLASWLRGKLFFPSAGTLNVGCLLAASKP